MIPLLDDFMGAERLLQSPLSHRYTLYARSGTYGLRQPAREKPCAGYLHYLSMQFKNMVDITEDE